MSKKKVFAADVLLGQCLEAARRRSGVARGELARKLRITDQQLAKYESGEFVPLPIMESIGDLLGNPIEKRLIRRISNLRKLEREKGEEQLELLDLYQQAFAEE